MLATAALEMSGLVATDLPISRDVRSLSLTISASIVRAWHHRKQVLDALSILCMMRIGSDELAGL